MKSERPDTTDVLRIGPSYIHGLGGFAETNLPSGATVVEYTGERITKAESLRRCEQGNWFIFALDDEFDLDGNVAANPAGFLNHSCAPNCAAERRDNGIWMVALRNIKAGEEITFNYGYTLDEYREHPCHCGAATCAGYILAEEFFDHVTKSESSVLLASSKITLLE
jgi:SET domain-containing protein